MTFFDFIFSYRPSIPNVRASISIKRGIGQKIRDLNENESNLFSDYIIFNNDTEIFDYLSTKIANYYFENEVCLKDLDSILPKEDYEATAEPDSFIDIIYLKHVNLSLVGINKFGVFGNHYETDYNDVYDEDDLLLINMDIIPYYERMVIESFIWNNCIDNVIEKLSKLTTFKLQKHKIEGVPCYVILTTGKIAQINSFHQLKMYVERFYYDDLRILGGLLKGNIKIDSAYINIPLGELPHFIELNVMLERLWIEVEEHVSHKKNFILAKVRFQTIINPDKSISLIPYPIDVERIIYEQILYWKRRGYIYYNYDEFDTYDELIVPDKIIHLFKYLKNNNLPLMYRRDESQLFIKKIARKEEKKSSDWLVSFYD